MFEFKPETSGKPSGFDRTLLNDDAVQVAQRARQIASELDYWYVATHHLLYSLVEYNFATRDNMFAGFDLPISNVKEAMLVADPPGESAMHFNLQTSVRLWDCYMHAILTSKTESRLATPHDILDGLFICRESVVDTVLASFGVEVFDNRQLRVRELDT